MRPSLRLREEKLLRTHNSCWVAIALLSTCLGCGSGGSTARVEGTITLDDKPLADIRVLFQPENKSAETAAMGSYGLTNAQGKYSLKLSDSNAPGAAIGRHTVTLADKLAEDAQDSDAGFSKGPKSRIPVKYLKTPLTFEVKPGATNDGSFQLTSK